ncbi:hypothetical protein [Amycolatopsis keratiniphila]|uniref:Uncharacterized protein n=1 Tax=Amycolatopsis keratiniphila subsp. keratiniphila TaxID=227715 RepID=A0A1W2M325_9PSEU|nr:hypothetical protein [Amycolatopsis keratiniphila]ONF73940.1 hypothetical protein AVR91_0204205 [Amycolatopsis keratiniphila subsp. keratiniphila]
MNQPTPVSKPPLLFVADELLDLDDSARSGFAVTVPCLDIGDGHVSVWPRFRVKTNPQGYALSMTLDLRAWCITVHGQEADLTLPMECHTQQAGQKAAETFRAHLLQNYVAAQDPEAVRQWCRWWVQNSDPYARVIE